MLIGFIFAGYFLWNKHSDRMRLGPFSPSLTASSLFSCEFSFLVPRWITLIQISLLHSHNTQ